MDNKEKVEKHFSIKFTDDWAKDCSHYIYEESTADGYTVYISTDDPANVDVNENVFYYDNDLGAELVRAIVDDKIDPGSKIHIGMLNDGEYWIEDAYGEIIEKLDL
jgi:hypothetical protein